MSHFLIGILKNFLLLAYLYCGQRYLVLWPFIERGWQKRISSADTIKTKNVIETEIYFSLSFFFKLIVILEKCYYFLKIYIFSEKNMWKTLTLSKGDLPNSILFVGKYTVCFQMLVAFLRCFLDKMSAYAQHTNLVLSPAKVVRRQTFHEKTHP